MIAAPLPPSLREVARRAGGSVLRLSGSIYCSDDTPSVASRQLPQMGSRECLRIRLGLVNYGKRLPPGSPGGLPLRTGRTAFFSSGPRYNEKVQALRMGEPGRMDDIFPNGQPVSRAAMSNVFFTSTSGRRYCL